MADQIDAGNNTFVYMGGDQNVPDGVIHVIIHPSVKNILERAFYQRHHLVSVIFHDDVEIIEKQAFFGCSSLRGCIKLLGVKEIEEKAFTGCVALSDVEFGDELLTIGYRAFHRCKSLRSIKMPSVRTVGNLAFTYCQQLTDVEFGSYLGTIGSYSFNKCPNLRRIAIPLKRRLFPLRPRDGRSTQFQTCSNLTKVDLVGIEGINSTISSLLLESWRREIKEEIGRINRELPITVGYVKTDAIRLWIISILYRMDRYKAEHIRLLKEHMTQLELAIWKAKLDEKEESSSLQQTKRAKIDVEIMRKEKRITSGANIIIKNVLPFLKLG